MAKRVEQNSGVSSRNSDVAAIKADFDLENTGQAGNKAQATEVIELAIDDIRLITSAFEIIDLSFQQFPDKFTQAAPTKLVPAKPHESEDEDSQVILH